MALVLPPMAMSATMAFAKDSRAVKIRPGFKIVPDLLDDAAPESTRPCPIWRASVAGMESAGKDQAQRFRDRRHGRRGPHGHAVAVGAGNSIFDAHQSSWVICRRGIPPNISRRPFRNQVFRRHNCREASDRPGKKEAAGADAPMIRAGVVLSQPPISTAPSIGCSGSVPPLPSPAGCDRAWWSAS